MLQMKQTLRSLGLIHPPKGIEHVVNPSTISLLYVRSSVVLLNHNRRSFAWAPDIDHLGNRRNKCEFSKPFEWETRLGCRADV